MEYLFYDYETTGTSKEYDQVLQFAAIRTDSNFSQLAEPINIFCKLRKDVLPSPWAIKVTGIDLNQLNENGLNEFEFAKKVEKELIGNGNQCIIGYNSKSFDDKFSQFLFYRNFIDPYRWSWDFQNSRLDLYDLILMGYSFNKLNNIKFSDGKSEDSLKLEDLSRFNALSHEKAHDALSDVRASIELMKLVKSGNPRLLDYALQLRVKSNATDLLKKNKMFYHIGAYYGYENKFVSLHHNIGLHPTNRNSYISWNLEYNPELILNLSAEEIRNEMFSKKEDRKIDVGFTEIKVNQNPGIISFNEKKLHPNIDPGLVKSNLTKLKQVFPKIKDLSDIVFKYEIPLIDADADLYAGEFFNEKKANETLINSVCNDPLSVNADSFNSIRFTKLLKRLTGRNFYDLLNNSDKSNFDIFCKRKFHYPGEDKWRTIKQYEKEYTELLKEESLTENQLKILKVMDDYVKKLL